LDAGRLRMARKTALAGTLAHAAADVQREPVVATERGDLGRDLGRDVEPVRCHGHDRSRRAARSTRSTIWAGETPAASAAKLMTSRCRNAGMATLSTSS